MALRQARLQGRFHLLDVDQDSEGLVHLGWMREGGRELGVSEEMNGFIPS
jgi:hypothetical protein